MDFEKTGHDVGKINDMLLSRGIFGGKDLSGEFPELGRSDLYCVTEKTGKKDIDRLVEVLSAILR